MARLTKDEREQVEDLARGTADWATQCGCALDHLDELVAAEGPLAVADAQEFLRNLRDLAADQKRRTARVLAHIDPSLVDLFM